ncbi:MAG: hypothetical protein WC974_09570 [Thermoplasmata archaeon]
MKKILALFVLLTVGTFAQGLGTYTPNYYLTKITTGTLNWADTLNGNWTKTDAAIKARQDTIDAVKADLYTEHGYNGVHQDNKLTLSMLQTAEKAKLVQTTGNQTITGVKNFNDGITVSGSFGLYSTPQIGSGAMWFTPTTFSELMFRSSTADDTIPNKAWVRANTASAANVVTLNNTQTITGTKYLNDIVLTKERLSVSLWMINSTPITFSYNSSYVRLTNTISLNAEVTNISSGIAGDIIYIENDDATYLTTFTDGTYFKLGATRILGKDDMLILLCRGTYWIEIGYSNN